MFCRYCGRELQENEVCTCRSAAASQTTQGTATDAGQTTAETKQTVSAASGQKAAAGKPSSSQSTRSAQSMTARTRQAGGAQSGAARPRQTSGTQQTANRTGQTSGQNRQTTNQTRQTSGQARQTADYARQTANQARQTLQSAAATVQSSGLVQSVMDLASRILRSQREALQEAYDEEDKTAQYCLGGLYLLFWFACVMMVFYKISKLGLKISGGKMFEYALGITLMMAVLKLAHGAWCYMFSDRQRSVKEACALFCANSLQETVDLVVLLLVLFISGFTSPMLLLFLLLLLLILGAVSNYNALCVICGEQRAFNLFLVLEIILIAIILFVGKSMVMNTLQGMIYSLEDLL